MSRLIIAFVVVAVVLTVYAVIDCAMTDAKRTRALSKPVWLLVTLIVPLVGPLLWILFGKGLLLKSSERHQSAPDDDEAFLHSLGQDSVHDDRIRQLEDELRALDEQLTSDDVAGETGATGRDTGPGGSERGDIGGDDEAPEATAASAATAERATDAASKGSTSSGPSTKGDTSRREASAGDTHETDDDERPGSGSGTSRA